jgi:ribA/ribD-fused uncharacterized protein
VIKRFRGEYQWLSNMVACKVTYDGIEYPSSEHAYQSAKSDDMEWKSLCANKQIPSKKIKVESRKVDIVYNWDDIKLEVMEGCLRSKFSKNPFRAMLEATGEQLIEEGNSWSDTFWGVDLKTGKGDNNLGKLIMKIRKENRNERDINREST